MSVYRLVEVLSKRDLRRFVKFPDELYRDCPQWEKTARAMAYAITHQDIYVEAEDGIGGRVYHYGDIAPVTQEAEALDFLTEPAARFAQAHPEWQLHIIERSDITGDYILVVTDFALPEDEESLRDIWQQNFEQLHQSTGL